MAQARALLSPGCIDYIPLSIPNNVVFSLSRVMQRRIIRCPRYSLSFSFCFDFPDIK